MTEAQNPLTPSPVVLHPPVTSDLPQPKRVLAIGAHPDDVDFCCGSTLAKWASGGAEVSILVCTDGSKGTWDPQADTESLVAQRQAEQRKAAARLGVTGEVGFLGWPDGELESTLIQRSQVALWIRKLRPDVVLGHDPWRPYRLHPDHRHAGWLVVDGLVAARDPKFFPEHSLAHHRPQTLLLFEAAAPDHFESVGGFFEPKLSALLAHGSQFETTMKADGSAQGNGEISGRELQDFRTRLEAKLTAAGTAAGVSHAEVFKLIDDL